MGGFLAYLVYSSFVCVQLELKNDMLQGDHERLSVDMAIMQSERAQLEQAEAEQLQYAHERFECMQL